MTHAAAAPTAGPDAPELPELRLKPSEERRLRAGHLWVFSNEVDTERTPLDGLQSRRAVPRASATATISSGYAYVNPHTLICARILGRDAALPAGPVAARQRLRAPSRCASACPRRRIYRWVYGESDGLPGLVLDRYGDVVVGQVGNSRHGGAQGARSSPRSAGARAARGRVEERLRRARPRGPAVVRRDGARRGARARRGPGEWRALPRAAAARARRPAGSTTRPRTGPRSLKYVPGARVLDVFSYCGRLGARGARGRARPR